jgi:hypothetical protein
MRTFKNTNSILIAGLIAMFMLISACSDNDNKVIPPPNEVYELAGTKWELIKLQNTDKNIERNIFVGDDVGTMFGLILNFETDVTGFLESSSLPVSFDLTRSPMFWHYTQEGGDNTTIHFREMMTSTLYQTSYKYEDSLIKFYHSPADGYYWHNGDGVIEQMMTYMKEVDGQMVEVEVTDSNAYNCFVFKRVTQ